MICCLFSCLFTSAFVYIVHTVLTYVTCVLSMRVVLAVCLIVFLFTVFPNMQGTLLLNFKMDACREKSLYCTVQNLELFSCSLASEQSTALSILEPVTINIELIPPNVRGGLRSAEESAKSKAFCNRMVPDAHILKVRLRVTCMHMPYSIHAYTCTHAHTRTRTHTHVSPLSLPLPLLISSLSLSCLPSS